MTVQRFLVSTKFLVDAKAVLVKVFINPFAFVYNYDNDVFHPLIKIANVDVKIYLLCQSSLILTAMITVVFCFVITSMIISTITTII